MLASEYMADPQPLFTVSNHHAESCGKPPHIHGDVRKRYENEYGEQAIFVYDYEVNEGTLWMGDAGWGKPYKVVNGTVPELVMGREEMIWLMNCWQTAVKRLPK